MEYYIKKAKETIKGKAIMTCIDLEVMANGMNIELWWILEEYQKELNKEIQRIKKGEN